jgi:hypothetical protein
MNKHKMKINFMAVTMALATSISHAAVINGELEFAGTVNKTSGIATNATNFGSNNKITVSTGDLASLVNIGYQFSLAGVNLGSVPTASWSIGNFNIVLNTSSILADGSPDPLDLFGTGTITDITNQYDATQFEWSFSETPFNSTRSLYSFRIDTVSEVPVPAAAWLMGSALVGLTSVARRRSIK